MGKKRKDGSGLPAFTPNHITHRINTAFLADELDPAPKIDWSERLEQCMGYNPGEGKSDNCKPQKKKARIKELEFELSGRDELISDMEAQIKKLEQGNAFFASWVKDLERMKDEPTYTTEDLYNDIKEKDAVLQTRTFKGNKLTITVQGE